MSNFTKVGEFHKLFGHSARTTPYYDVFDKDPSLVKFRQAMIDEENKEFKDACEEKNLVEVADALADMLYFIYGTGHVFGLNLDDIFAEVHNSNLSKLCKTEEEAKQTVVWYLENEPRYEDPQYRKTEPGDYWVVYDAKTSKILKSINFKLPNLKPLIDRESSL
jgi:predicted HAD superfamily Cof-like phosphohydrolase